MLCGKSISMEEAAEHITVESSIGTWTKISTMNTYCSQAAPHCFLDNQG
ncbi:MAG: hypothetical protein R6V53_00400 [Candidatus Woesearchaeota archaeon]